MISLGRSIPAEWMKLRATSVKWVFLLIPLVCAIIFLSYFGAINENDPDKLYIFYMEAICIALPFLIGIICGFTSMQEETAGHFHVLLSGTSRYRNYVSKLAALVILTTCSIVAAVILFVLGATYLLDVEQIRYMIYMKACIALIFGCIILYIIHLFIAFVFGMGASVTLGGAGFLLTGLMATGLGDGIWQYVPWAWTIRWVDLIIVLNSTRYPDDMHIFIRQEMYNSIQYMTIYTVILFGASLWWFHRWEGRQSSD